MLKKILVLTLCISGVAFSQSSPGPGAQDYSARRITFALEDPPQQVQNAGVSRIGNPGPATYYYWIVSNSAAGASSPAGPFLGSQGPNALSSTNFFQISWNTVPGATSYDVLRTTIPFTPSGACACAVATGNTSGTVNDQSNTLNPYTVNALDPSTLAVSITNESQSTGVSNLVFRVGNLKILSLPSNTTSGFAPSFTPVTHQFLTGLTSGAFSAAQPACGDLSNAAASCSTDATNASNISTGTLPAGRLPTPTASTLGGVQSLAATAHQFLTSISTAGAPAAAQPASADISDGTGSGVVARQTGAALVTPSIGGETISASPRITWDGFLSGSLTTSGIGYVQWTPDKAITITRFESLTQNVSPSGCSTNAVLDVFDNTSTTSLTSITLTSQVVDSGALAVNVTGGHVLRIRVQTGAVGCTATPANAAVTVQYRMQ
ncbi:MAG TPA: hypothetical protein VFB79_06165 [Candidatus Angelobacter sp.]|nr:hypothetical protein [Candidatus Angelobacter sp.]